MTDLLASASRAEPWARALEAGLAKHGPTPIYQACLDAMPAAAGVVELGGEGR